MANKVHDLSTTEQKSMIISILADFAADPDVDVLFAYLRHCGLPLPALRSAHDIVPAFLALYRIRPGHYDVGRACRHLATWLPIASQCWRPQRPRKLQAQEPLHSRRICQMICDGKAAIDIRRLWCKDVNALVIDGVRLPIVRIPCHLGGERNWFLCPHCARRCVLLYGKDYRCRTCVKGYYASEHLSPRERKARKAFATRRRLGQTFGGIIAPFPSKPKHMHWSTYLRIRAAAEAEELRILQKDLADVRRSSKGRR